MRPDPNTIAFGGVATGIIKAQLAAIVAVTTNNNGSIPNGNAMAARIGTKVAVVARLLVSSVRKITIVATDRAISKG